VATALAPERVPAWAPGTAAALAVGVVEMEAVVMPDGSVGRVKITRSLDRAFGLDEEAIKAVKQWRFRPGMLKGQPVAVIVNVELTFTLR
jgi:protein TonB